MDTYNVALFSLIGLLIAVILTGGLISMTSGDEPSFGQLAAGASVGAAAGGALGMSSLDTIMKTVTPMMQTGGGQEMKMGLPSF